MFKLRKQLPNDLLWVLDENKKVLHFETIKDLIVYFIDFRLKKYKDRKKRLVTLKEEQLKENSDLIKFISLVCSGKLKIMNRSKAEIKVDLEKKGLDIKLISTPLSKCTIDEMNELQLKNTELVNELDYLKRTTEKEMYLNDLKELRINIAKDF